MTFDSKNYLFSHKSLPSRIKYEIDRQRECIRATLGADFAKVMEYVNVKLPARFNPQIKEHRHVVKNIKLYHNHTTGKSRRKIQWDEISFYSYKFTLNAISYLELKYPDDVVVRRAVVFFRTLTKHDDGIPFEQAVNDLYEFVMQNAHWVRQ